MLSQDYPTYLSYDSSSPPFSDSSYNPSPGSLPCPPPSSAIPPYFASLDLSEPSHIAPSRAPSYSSQSSQSSSGNPRSMRRSSKLTISHPYARLYARKDVTKRRKIWNHVLEKSLFSPHELSTLGAPHRRTIYIASLEAHIDRLHSQLLSYELYPIPFDKLEPYKGLNSKTAKSMVSGLQHDATHTKLKLLELQRSNNHLRDVLSGLDPRSTCSSNSNSPVSIGPGSTAVAGAHGGGGAVTPSTHAGSHAHSPHGAPVNGGLLEEETQCR
ncbi:hypothetical protein SERLADRAFT_408728 [Serpula lacrymans var. lacrymans S7.9]|uniref:Uncharacterized protein n=2 Tax=Serpula lacrymans var. lacrymans TaxID=341189 RepID=F8NW15_SERL9|nr:uncharacterized protein SERLADRAFT_408728 [Serpula lacrymans var. lacrymans S7.9]EGO24949.1 hypothetical protein SERLADRAFT_408728 [Serpula lacrymans var. lacrymans S7.9]